jgi:hypothetical protein
VPPPRAVLTPSSRAASSRHPRTGGRRAAGRRLLAPSSPRPHARPPRAIPARGVTAADQEGCGGSSMGREREEDAGCGGSSMGREREEEDAGEWWRRLSTGEETWGWRGLARVSPGAFYIRGPRLQWTQVGCHAGCKWAPASPSDHWAREYAAHPS